MQGRFADRVDVPIGGTQLVIHHDAAAAAYSQPAVPRQFVARANASRDDDHADIQTPAVREGHAVDPPVAQHLVRGLA